MPDIGLYCTEIREMDELCKIKWNSLVNHQIYVKHDRKTKKIKAPQKGKENG